MSQRGTAVSASGYNEAPSHLLRNGYIFGIPGEGAQGGPAVFLKLQVTDTAILEVRGHRAVRAGFSLWAETRLPVASYWYSWACILEPNFG